MDFVMISFSSKVFLKAGKWLGKGNEKIHGTFSSGDVFARSRIVP